MMNTASHDEHIVRIQLVPDSIRDSGVLVVVQPLAYEDAARDPSCSVASVERFGDLRLGSHDSSE
jgi:hypothetical protein